MQTHLFDSVFGAGLKVDIANYLTELLIKNRLDWLKKPLPRSPFWRNEIADNDKEVSQLRTTYQAELTAVHDLLNVFSPTVLATYFKTNRVVGYRLVKDETKKKILLDLFKNQVKFVKSLSDLDKQGIKLADDKREFTGTASMPANNKMSNLDG